MPLATIANLEKSFGNRILFQNLDFQIDSGQRVALIGDNGAGKTTLLKILTGQTQGEAGSVSVAASVKIGHLLQDPVFDPANTVLDEAELAFADLHELSHRLRIVEHDMAHKTGDELDAILKTYQKLQHQFELAGGYAWQHKLEATLLGVGLDKSIWEQPVTTLSGGQRSRLALAKVLISQPDLLLLDEPTNHLDLAAIEWLENFLLEFRGAVLLISHDRFLLDRLATRIVWLTQHRLKNYPGNYTAFTQQREVQELSQQRAHDEQHADIEKQKEYIRRFGAGQRARQAMGRRKRLERLLESDQIIDAVQSQKQIRFSIDTDRRAGDQALTVRELSKSFGSNTLWHGIGFQVRRGERIGIIGPNGSGKTTLLQILMARADADGGTVKWGANISVGYYDQSLDDLDPLSTVFDEVAADRTGVTVQEIRDLLGMFLFRGDDIEKPIQLLSGGERARVRLAQLLLDKPNVLLLDEPTNHLDIPSREALESALGDFSGTLMCVSHDRYFLDKIAGRMLILQPPQLIDFDGGYRRWAAGQRSAPVRAPEKKSAPPAARKRSAPRKENPYSRPFGRLNREELESQISQTEAGLKECQAAFASAEVARNPSRLTELQTRHDTLTEKLKSLEAEYFARDK